MKTDDLIRALAGDTVVEPRPKLRLVWLVPALATGLVLLLLTFGPRPDLGTALRDPVSAMRLVLSLSLGGIALWAALRLARPGAAVALWPLAGVAGVAVGLWVAAYVATPPEALGMAVRGKTMVGCLTTIPLLALLPTAVVLRALRQGAPTRPTLTGAVAGLAGGGFAAAIYALHCTEDSPLFYVTWYGLAILAVATVSAISAKWALRW